MIFEYNKCWDNHYEEDYYGIFDSKYKMVGTAISTEYAALFVKAPEMLELLESVLSDLESGNDGMFANSFVNNLKNVIEQAKGGQING